MGGFPDPVLSLGRSARARWHAGYFVQTLGRDVASLGVAADTPRLSPYPRAYALESSGVSDDATVLGATGPRWGREPIRTAGTSRATRGARAC